MTIHVLFEGSTGEVLRDDDVVLEGVGLDELVAAAVRAAGTARRVQLCGGVPVEIAAQVREAVRADVEVRVNRYGFESLEQAAAYKQAFAVGTPGDAVFLYRTAASTPLVQHEGALVAGVADDAALTDRVREAQERGAGLVELYAGLGLHDAVLARAACAGELPVGLVD